MQKKSSTSFTATHLSMVPMKIIVKTLFWLQFSIPKKKLEQWLNSGIVISEIAGRSFHLSSYSSFFLAFYSCSRNDESLSLPFILFLSRVFFSWLSVMNEIKIGRKNVINFVFDLA